MFDFGGSEDSWILLSRIPRVLREYSGLPKTTMQSVSPLVSLYDSAQRSSAPPRTHQAEHISLRILYGVNTFH